METSQPLPILEVKTAAGGERIVEGYVSTFDAVDLGGDVVLPGAFDASLAGGRRVPFLRGHDHNAVLGTTLSLRADHYGLHGRFKLSRTPLGDETYQLLKDGALDSFSIGYLPDVSERRTDGVRELKQLTLLEASVVTLAMNPAAMVTAVKGKGGRGRGTRFANDPGGLHLRFELMQRRLRRAGILDADFRVLPPDGAGTKSAQAEALRLRLRLLRRRLELVQRGA